MTIETLFSTLNVLAMSGWLLLVGAPRDRRAIVTAGTIIPALLSVTYLVLFGLHIRESHGGFSSLHAVTELFSNPWLLLAGWVHYLAFDLLVGTWETTDAVARGLSRWLVLSCLILRFWSDPSGGSRIRSCDGRHLHVADHVMTLCNRGQCARSGPA
jgi:hypothetical protein